MPRNFAVLIFLIVAVITIGGFAHRLFAEGVVHEPTTMPVSPNALEFKVKDIDGKDVDLTQYRGKVVMMVNVASKCGFTKQYTALEELYKSHADKGFVIIGFPANNFGHQEPGSNSEIKEFCSSKFSVTFPMMAKISVKGSDKDAWYKFLTEEPTAGDFKGEIAWNFTKFVIDKNGNVIARFPSNITPDDPALVGIIDKAIAAK